MPRHKKEPYHCPRCGYTSEQKSFMKKHFYMLKKPCPATKLDVVLTDELKTYILDNRVYHEPKPQKEQINQTITNYNQYNNVNNIIAGMDVVEKLEHYMAYKNEELVDFETTVEKKFKTIADRLDRDAFNHVYTLDDSRILDIVAKPIENCTQPKMNGKIHANHNVIYDSKLKELKIYDGQWEMMDINAGTRHYIEVIQRNFLNSYERYLLRQVTICKIGQEKAKFREMIEAYFAFIACFDIEPFCKDTDDESILRPVSSNDDESDDDCDDNEEDIRLPTYEQASYTISDEYYPVFRRIAKGLKKMFVNKTIKSVQDTIKRNSIKNVIDLNKKITKIFHMDETFRDMLLSIQQPM